MVGFKELALPKKNFKWIPLPHPHLVSSFPQWAKEAPGSQFPTAGFSLPFMSQYKTPGWEGSPKVCARHLGQKTTDLVCWLYSTHQCLRCLYENSSCLGYGCHSLLGQGVPWNQAPSVYFSAVFPTCACHKDVFDRMFTEWSTHFVVCLRQRWFWPLVQKFWGWMEV